MGTVFRGERMKRQVVQIAGALVLATLLLGCEKGDAEPSSATLHPLAASMSKVRARLSGLTEEEAESIDSFLTHSDPGTAVFQVRRICGFVGKGMKSVDPAVVGDFVLSSSDNLYDDYFRAFDDEQLLRIAGALRGRPETEEIEQLMIEAVIRIGRGAFNGTLKEALRDVPFEDAVAPRRLPLRRVLPAEEADLETFTGAAEILRLDAFIEEGAQPDIAVQTYRQALLRWPEDPALVAGLASVYVENSSRFREELREFLSKAGTHDRGNAIYDYLRAGQLFRVGKDDEALVALRAALQGDHVSFHGLERAKRTAAFLRKKGYGPIRARLAGYRATSLAACFELKDLANRAIQRSREYENAGQTKRVETVVEVPLVLDRQFGSGSHMLLVQVVRATILSSGLRRIAESMRAKDPTGAGRLRELAETAEQRLRAIDKGRKMRGGGESLGQLYRLLGEKRFLNYVEGVLYGNEALFLERCADCESMKQVVTLTQKSYEFD
jgi:hypothetical protein